MLNIPITDQIVAKILKANGREQENQDQSDEESADEEEEEISIEEINITMEEEPENTAEQTTPITQITNYLNQHKQEILETLTTKTDPDDPKLLSLIKQRLIQELNEIPEIRDEDLIIKLIHNLNDPQNPNKLLHRLNQITKYSEPAKQLLKTITLWTIQQETQIKITAIRMEAQGLWLKKTLEKMAQPSEKLLTDTGMQEEQKKSRKRNLEDDEEYKEIVPVLDWEIAKALGHNPSDYAQREEETPHRSPKRIRTKDTEQPELTKTIKAALTQPQDTNTKLIEDIITTLDLENDIWQQSTTPLATQLTQLEQKGINRTKAIERTTKPILSTRNDTRKNQRQHNKGTTRKPTNRSNTKRRHNKNRNNNKNL